MPTPEEVMQRPYHLVAIKDGDSYFAQVLEFPGCFAVAHTPSDAIREVHEVALDWLEVAIMQGQSIPEPLPFKL